MFTPKIQEITNKYIQENLENSRKINYAELASDPRVKIVLYKDLPDTEVEGYPFASDYVSQDGKAYSMEEFVLLSDEQKAKCELRYYYLPTSHELYVGTTGSGKTTGCIEPQLRAISSQKNKPNLFVTDPKGELFDHNAQHLKDEGYQLFVINFKDVARSDRWNPLAEIYDLKMSEGDIGKDAIYRKGKPSKSLLVPFPKKKFGDSHIEYKNMAFATQNDLDVYLKFEKDFLGAKIDSMLTQIAHMMIEVQSKNDKTWEYGAQNLLKGLIKCMLEDAYNPISGFTKEMMTLKTLQEYYLAIKGPVLTDADSGRRPLNEYALLKNKSAGAIALMSTALANAPNTMRSYCGVFDDSMKEWFQGHIFALTTSNTVEIANLDKPFAVFLITRDYEKSDFKIAGLFIDWVYRQMIEEAEKVKSNDGTRGKRPTHFLLDEFGNIPPIKDFENKVSTARSRNVWFHLVVQSYKQIDLVYGEERTTVIRDNCNSQIFLGAQNRNTKEIFSKECGEHSVESLRTKLDPAVYELTQVPLVPMSDLDLIKPGEMYIKRLYMPVITSQFIRSYVCAQQGAFKGFFNSNGLDTCTPIVIDPFNAEKYTYKKLYEPQRTKRNDWDF